MRTDRLAVLVVALGLSLSLQSAPQAGPKDKVPAGKKPTPLVRKDLLVFGKGEIAPPRRDIFRPRDYGQLAAPPVVPAGRPAPKRPGPAVKAETSFVLDLVYLGSVRSGGRIVALILRDGQTMSVAEGDQIIPGYTAVRVTAEEIEVEGPDSQRKTFPRQGERP